MKKKVTSAVSESFLCPQCLDRAGPRAALCVRACGGVSMFSDVMCKLTKVFECVCADAVISGQRAQEEQVWNVLQSSGMSVALDPRRPDEPLDGQRAPPFPAAPIRRGRGAACRIL